MDFYDVVRKRRSVRQFVPSEIADEALERIAEAGRLAPSGCNVQNRDFILVRDRQLLTDLHDKLQPDFKNAAAAIVVVMDEGGTRYGSYWLEDGSAAVQNILLAIVAEGYDSVWIEGTLRPHEAWVRKLLGIPAEKRVFAALPIGKAAKEGRCAPKKELQEILHRDRFRA